MPVYISQEMQNSLINSIPKSQGSRTGKGKKSTVVLALADTNALLKDAGTSVEKIAALKAAAKSPAGLSAQQKKTLKAIAPKIKAALANVCQSGQRARVITASKIVVNGKERLLAFPTGSVVCSAIPVPKIDPKTNLPFKKDRAKCPKSIRKSNKDFNRANPNNAQRCVAKWVRTPRNSSIYPAGTFKPSIPKEIRLEAAAASVEAKGLILDDSYDALGYLKATGKVRVRAYHSIKMSKEQMAATKAFTSKDGVKAAQEGNKLYAARLAALKLSGTAPTLVEEKRKLRAQAIVDIVAAKGQTLSPKGKVVKRNLTPSGATIDQLNAEIAAHQAQLRDNAQALVTKYSK